MAEFKESRQKRKRERYSFVQGTAPELFTKIVAFASTVDLRREELAVRADIEDYCIALAARLLEEA